MYPLSTHFDELFRRIVPPPERLKAARDVPNPVRDYLKRHKIFETLEPHSRLVGSYAQKLAVNDVKDVDFLVRVDGDPEANSPEAKLLIQDLRRALSGLPEALGYEGYADVDITRGRRSVHVHIHEPDFHLDVVPCIAPNGFDEVLYVPDRGYNKWIESHPVGVIELLARLNQEHDGKVKPVARLLKHFRDHRMVNRKPKSYWLLALVVHHVAGGNLDTSKSLGELFHDLLAEIYSQYACLLGRDDEATPNIADPMLGHNVSWNWSRNAFETFMRRVKEGRDWAQKALAAEDRETAVSYWQKVFGSEYFPTCVDDVAEELAAALAPGMSYVTGSGLVIPTNPEAGIVTQIRKTTFHGSRVE